MVLNDSRGVDRSGAKPTGSGVTSLISDSPKRKKFALGLSKLRKKVKGDILPKLSFPSSGK